MAEAVSGFHGTFGEHVENILNSGFKATYRKDHWLGQGVYFYKDDEEQAKVWASTKKRRDPRSNTSSIAVIEVIIFVSEAEMLNLNLRKGVWSLINFAKWLITSSGVQLKLDPKNKNVNRCFLLDYMSERKGIKVIIASFNHVPDHLSQMEAEIGSPLGICFSEDQICVRSQDTIICRKCIYPENILPPDKERIKIDKLIKRKIGGIK